jgi:hypothetical protein
MLLFFFLIGRGSGLPFVVIYASFGIDMSGESALFPDMYLVMCEIAVDILLEYGIIYE